MTAAQKRLTLAAAILGSITAFIDSTVVNVALPRIRDDLGGGLAGQQWLTDAYLLTLGSLLLVGGSLGDLYGRRRIFALGLAGFGAASMLGAAAPSSWCGGSTTPTTSRPAAASTSSAARWRPSAWAAPSTRSSRVRRAAGARRRSSCR